MARVYDALLGGKDNYIVDRDVAARLTRTQPLVAAAVHANRAFVHRAVTLLAASGITQFLDLGCGIPTPPAVHQVAMEVDPDARVAYVDRDPVVLAHTRALPTDGSHTATVPGDIRRPEAILTNDVLRAHLDLERPVAVLLAAVLHTVPGHDHPARIIATLRQALVPGSALVLSHPVPPADGRHATCAALRLYAEAVAAVTIRTQDQIASWFTGFRLLSPGLVPADAWRHRASMDAPVVAGVAILDRTGHQARHGNEEPRPARRPALA
jgi:SAM-dependent methyltransferase